MPFSLYSLLGVTQLDEDGKLLVSKYTIITTMIRSLFLISSTFFALYFIDFSGYSGAATLFAIGYIIQAVTDYPTGVLSDWLGHRWVLFMAYFGFSASFFLFSFAQTYQSILVAYVLYSLALAQQSGAMESWFDNNYRVLAKEVDSKREIYQEFRGKVRVVFDTAGGIMMLLGGALATIYGRELVFLIQSAAFLLLAFIMLFTVKDHQKRAEQKKTEPYFHLLFDGILMVLQNRPLFFMVLAAVLFDVTMAVFGELVLFPIYFGYTGNDFGAAVFRFVLFVVGILGAWIIAEQIKKRSAFEWLAKIHLLHSVIFYLGGALAFAIFPIRNTFDLSGAIVLGLFVMITHLLRVVIDIFLMRVYLDLVEDDRRNGFYSLIPTLSLVFSSPIIIVSGRIIDNSGFSSLYLFLAIFGFFSTLLYFIATRFLKEQK